MEQRHLRLGYHLVALLDVLGQRDRFRALHLPSTPEDATEVTEVLRQTAGFVMELRGIFGRQFTTFESGLHNLKQHTNQQVRPKFVGFSDSFITSAPLHNDSSALVPIVTVFSVLSAASVVMLTSLACKHPLRGGIDVGLATEIGPGEIYGAALERAYLLESKEAKYPRIVIGDEIWNYLTASRANFLAQATPESKSIIAIIGKIMQLIATDRDGKRILDYLGPIVREHAGSGENLHNFTEGMVKPTYEFALTEQKRINVGNDLKLIPRYQALRNYVESRLGLWNVETEKT